MSTIALSVAQLTMLRQIATGKLGASGAVEFPCATLSQQSTAKALKARGFIRVYYIASRLFGAQLTSAGRIALQQNDLV